MYKIVITSRSMAESENWWPYFPYMIGKKIEKKTERIILFVCGFILISTLWLQMQFEQG